MTVRVGIVCGGRTGEHEVSLRSAWGIYHAFGRARFEPLLIAIDPSGVWRVGSAEDLLRNPDDPARIHIDSSAEPVIPIGDGEGVVLAGRDSRREVARVDLIFPIVHGTDGEDGALQGLLRLLDVPFVGADVLGSAVAMDKGVMKRLLAQAGLPTARWRELREPPGNSESAALFARLEREWGAPLFVKPAALGSSVGVNRAADAAEFAAALAEAFRFDRKVLVEEAMPGREIECSVLGNLPPSDWPPEASLSGEVIPKRGFYSYAAKYLDDDGADLAVPAELDEATTAQVREMAVRVFQALEADGMARVDFFLKPDGGLVVNEINTLPGFTPISMFPKLWEATGLPYPELLERLADLALERHRHRRRLQRHVELPTPPSPER